MQPDFQTVVNSVGDLPTMPAVAIRIINQLQDPDSSADSLSLTVAHDPALAARVLKIANSSFYSLKRQVRTLDNAIVILGEKTLRSLVLAASLKGMNKNFGLLEKMLWEDSIGCAIGCRLAASSFGVADAEEAFVAGLFRHLGKVVMNYSDPEDFQEMIQAVYNGEGGVSDLEQRFFPYSHALVGAAVLKKWNFSDNLIQSALHHADLEIDAEENPALFRLIATVNFAGAMCQSLGIGQREPDPGVDLGNNKGALAVGLDAQAIAELRKEVVKAFTQNRDYFLG